MSANTENKQSLYVFLLTLGGLCLGVGVLHLIWSFGWPEGTFNSDFRSIGFSGIDNIAFLPTADWSIPLVVLGAILMIFANAIAWRFTDGY